VLNSNREKGREHRGEVGSSLKKRIELKEDEEREKGDFARVGNKGRGRQAHL